MSNKTVNGWADHCLAISANEIDSRRPGGHVGVARFPVVESKAAVLHKLVEPLYHSWSPPAATSLCSNHVSQCDGRGRWRRTAAFLPTFLAAETTAFLPVHEMANGNRKLNAALRACTFQAAVDAHNVLEAPVVICIPQPESDHHVVEHRQPQRVRDRERLHVAQTRRKVTSAAEVTEVEQRVHSVLATFDGNLVALALTIASATGRSGPKPLLGRHLQAPVCRRQRHVQRFESCQRGEFLAWDFVDREVRKPEPLQPQLVGARVVPTVKTGRDLWRRTTQRGTVHPDACTPINLCTHHTPP